MVAKVVASLQQALADRNSVAAADTLASALSAGEPADLLTIDRLVPRLGELVSEYAEIRIGLLGSFTTNYYARLLRVALLRCGVRATIDNYGYDQYAQQILDPESELHRSNPRVIVLATHHDALRLPDLVDDPVGPVEAELDRWTALWEAGRRLGTARIVQLLPALPDERGYGNLALRVAGSWFRMAVETRLRLARAAVPHVLTVDAERLAALIGKRQWFDPVSWRRFRQPMSMAAAALLARDTAAVIAGDLGLAKRCVVVDLDNTIWGGVIGEDGLSGLVLGGDDGAGYRRLQEYLLGLRARGLLLAVCSKNSLADAQLPFLRHADMRMRLEHISDFSAAWTPKSTQIREIADRLGLSPGSLLVIDDNPVERAEIRSALPEVEVLDGAHDPDAVVAALAEYPLFERGSLTADDQRRADSYAARERAEQLRVGAKSMEEFYTGLDMRAELSGIDDVNLPRVAQLVAKTNQFNLTGRRRTEGALAELLARPGMLGTALRLRDRFADHGIVGVVLARFDAGVLEVDTWLLSCRILGRTVERTVFRWLAERAAGLEATAIVGTYVPTARNEAVATLYEDLGCTLIDRSSDGTTTWRFMLDGGLPPVNPFVHVTG
jgi:FkbH-like protein